MEQLGFEELHNGGRYLVKMPKGTSAADADMVCRQLEQMCAGMDCKFMPLVNGLQIVEVEYEEINNGTKPAESISADGNPQ